MSLFKSVSLTVVAMGALALPALADWHGHGGYHGGTRFSLNIGLPFLFVGTNYCEPRPVYYAPVSTCYVPPPVYYAPAPTYYVQPPAYCPAPPTYCAPAPAVVRQRCATTLQTERVVEAPAQIRFETPHVVTTCGVTTIETVTTIRSAPPQTVATHGSVWIEATP